jgi:hypothetical protein
LVDILDSENPAPPFPMPQLRHVDQEVCSTMLPRTIGALVILTLLACATPTAQSQYPWLREYNPQESIAARIGAPEGFVRQDLAPGSFADWLRHLPLKPGKPPVMLHNGRRKANQDAHVAVVDIDVGTGDLQQCADAVIRLRAEYLYSQARYDDIHFNFTSGDEASYGRWIEGYRPAVHGNHVSWAKSARRDSSRAAFEAYLKKVFTYAGSYSLSKELIPVGDVTEISIGDVFILGNFPGHAVMVVDVAVERDTGEKLFLLAQSYMPAQEIHILKNPSDKTLSPWYDTGFGNILRTPEWIFRPSHLMRWDDPGPPSTGSSD